MLSGANHLLAPYRKSTVGELGGVAAVLYSFSLNTEISAASVAHPCALSAAPVSQWSLSFPPVSLTPLTMVGATSESPASLSVSLSISISLPPSVSGRRAWTDLLCCTLCSVSYLSHLLSLFFLMQNLHPPTFWLPREVIRHHFLSPPALPLSLSLHLSITSGPGEDDRLLCSVLLLKRPTIKQVHTKSSSWTLRGLWNSQKGALDFLFVRLLCKD